MQQRQPRLGDILDDYCPRERRLTNHAVVAMVGDQVKQTRCTTCDADHEYKHAKVPRLKPKTDAAGAIGQSSTVPRRILPTPEPGNAAVDPQADHADEGEPPVSDAGPVCAAAALASDPPDPSIADEEGEDAEEGIEKPEEGPVHRRLIRATLPRTEGQPPPERPAPDFTIRQPAGRTSRFRGRHPRSGGGGGGQFSQGRGGTNGNFGGPPRSAGRQGPGRPPSPPRSGGRHGSGRKRSK